MALTTLREREAAPFPWTGDDLRELASLPPGTLAPEARGGRSLRAGDRVGFARLPSGAVRVVPKASAACEDRAAGNVLALLARAGLLPRALRADDLAPVRGDWIEALIGLFAREAASQLAQGLLLRDRRVADDASLALRGRWRVERDRPDRRHVFAVEYTQRHPDVPPMRALRWAARRLMALSRHAPHRALLARVDADLTEVVPEWPASAALARTEARYAPALRLATMLREGLTTALAPGPEGAVAFWVAMDPLFERTVARLASSAAPTGWTVASQDTSRWLGLVLGKPAVRLRPDVVVRDPSGTPQLVVDAKHKVFDREPSEGDLYQAFAYVRRFGVPRAVLLYPQMPEAAPVRWRLELDSQGVIEARSLDLTDDLTKPAAWVKLGEEMREVMGLG